MRRLWLVPLALLLSACTPMLHIHRLGIHERIVSGGQATIDQGNVAYLYGNLLAGHRSTNGSVFAALPSIRVGERFWTTAFIGGRSQEWKVVKKVVTASNSAGQISGWPLVLQTSVPGGRLLVFCQPT